MQKILKYSKLLEEVGFTRDQAEAHLTIISEFVEEDLATKTDVQQLNEKIDGSVQALNDKIDLSVQALNEKIDLSVQALNDKIDLSVQALNEKIDNSVLILTEKIVVSEQKLTIRLGSILVVTIATVATLFKFFI